MSRKAAERRSSPSGFVEARLWVISRGREYKPRFVAERAVVIVSGGQSHLVDPDIPVTASGSRPPPKRHVNQKQQQPQQRHPMECLLHLAPCADALFATTGCETVFVIDYSPLARDVALELESPYPGRVAKPVARLLQKLNVADAVVAADGADVAVLFKALPLIGGGTQGKIYGSGETAAHV